MMKNNFLQICAALLFIQASLGGLEQDLSTIGTLHPSSKSLIGTQVTGKIETIWVDVGTPVKKNQPLVQIDKRYYLIDLAQKTAALESAKIEKSDAEINYKRMQKLWEKPEGEAPSISLKRYEDAKIKFEQSQVNFKLAQENFNRAKLNLEETTIRAPFDGIVTKKFLDIGESLPTQPVTNVVEIQSLNPLYLEFCIPQSYAAHFTKGYPITFKIEGVELNNHQATIDLFYPSLDENTRSLRCRAIIDNSDFKIRPGSLAKVTLPTGMNKHIEGNNQ